MRGAEKREVEEKERGGTAGEAGGGATNRAGEVGEGAEEVKGSDNKGSEGGGLYLVRIDRNREKEEGVDKEMDGSRLN